MYLIRHAETVWNAAGIGYGRTDIPLSAEGHRSAWGYRLPEGVRRVFTSPLTRAYETANVIAHRYHLPSPTPVDALIERDHGQGEGIAKTQLPPHIEGRETDAEIRARVLPFLTHLTPDTLIVTHAGVITAVTGQKVDHLNAVEWRPGWHEA